MPRDGFEFRWVSSPQDLAHDVDRFGHRVIQAVRVVADYHAAQMQNNARRDAPWLDRTGMARKGLFAGATGGGLPDLIGHSDALADCVPDEAVEGRDDLIIIVLGHTMSYGQYLELAMAGTYAIIMPTIEWEIDEIQISITGLIDRLENM